MLTVLMATYNGAATLPKLLNGCLALRSPERGWNLVVVDNGSTDNTKHVVDAYVDQLPLHYLYETRRGKNAALNTGLAFCLKHLPTDLFVFTDDDITPAPDWLQNLVLCAEAHAEAAIFGGSIVPDWAEPPPEWLLRLVPLGLSFGLTSVTLADGPVHPGLVWGANMAIRREVFDAGHRFSETVGPNGGDYAMGSEIELTRRLHLLGYQSWFCPAARVAHHIRAHQMSKDYALLRAWRHGRGKFRQDVSGLFPELFGIPRWMFARFAMESLGWLQARARNRADACFLHRWEMACLRGYFYEARRHAVLDTKTVLITSHSGELGGMEMRMAQEARFLSAEGYRAILGVRRFAGLDEWRQRVSSADVVISHFEPPPVFEQWRWRRFNRLRAVTIGVRKLRAYRADLVHVALCWTSYGLSALWLAHRAGLPVVVSVHNSFPPEPLGAWHALLLREAFRSVRGIYAVSQTAMRHFQQIFRHMIGADVRQAVIPNCVDTHRFAPSPTLRGASRAALQLPDDALVIGSVARLSPQKCPEALIDLYDLLSPQFPQLVMVLAGRGPQEAALRDLVRQRGLEGKIIFAGFVPQVERMLPAFDLHLLMSRNEGFGIATIEAMACGVPAVATAVPGSVDILADCKGGLLVPPNDLPVTAAIIAGLLANPQQRACMAKAARSEAEQRYSLEVVGKQVRDFYDGLL